MTTDRCRICGSHENLKHILQDGQELLKKLRLCANISMDFEGFLPTHICLKCEHGLNFSYQLRKQGEAMELRLRQELLCKAGLLDLSNEVDDIEDELGEFPVENLKRKNYKRNDENEEIFERAENGKDFGKPTVYMPSRVNAAVGNSNYSIAPLYNPTFESSNNSVPVYIKPACANPAVSDNLSGNYELVAHLSPPPYIIAHNM